MSRYYYDKKNTVDDYKKFTISFLKKNWYLNPWINYKSGWMVWWRGETRTGDISFIVEKDDVKQSWYVRVMFTQTDRDTQEKTSFDYQISIISTSCNYWGHRWWFLDPCSKENIRCNILYLQNNGYFTSRKTLNLTYDSRNEPKTWLWWSEMKILKAEALYDKIKYPYRNGRPTRKMQRVIKYIKQTRYHANYCGDIANIFWYR